MPSVLYPPARPQSIGEVLDSAFRIFRATLLRCLPYGVLATVAGQLQNIYDIVSHHPLRQFGRQTDPVWWLLYVSGAFLAYAFVNVILIRQASMASGVYLPARTTLIDGLRKAPAATGMLLLIGSAVALCFLPLVVVPRAYMNWAILVLAVPATYVAVALSCSWVALLIGRKGIFASLAYSVHLVRGNWWRTVMVYLVAGAMLGVLFVSAGVVAAVLIPFASGGDVAVTTAVSAVMVAALGAVYVPFFTSMSLALYGDLETRKEGTDLERRIAGAPAG